MYSASSDRSEVGHFKRALSGEFHTGAYTCKAKHCWHGRLKIIVMTLEGIG